MKIIQDLDLQTGICWSLYTLNCTSWVRGLSATGLAKAKRNTVKTQAVFMSRFLCWWGVSIGDRRELSLSQQRQVLTESIAEVQWGSQRGEWLFSIRPHGRVLHIPSMTDRSHNFTERLVSIIQNRNRTKTCIASRIAVPNPFQFQIYFP